MIPKFVRNTFNKVQRRVDHWWWHNETLVVAIGIISSIFLAGFIVACAIGGIVFLKGFLIIVK